VVSQGIHLNPEGVALPVLSMFNPFRVGLSIGHGHGFRMGVTRGYSN